MYYILSYLHSIAKNSSFQTVVSSDEEETDESFDIIQEISTNPIFVKKEVILLI